MAFVSGACRFEFTLVGAREKDFELHAETEADRAAWMSVLQHVAEVANARDAYFKAKGIDVTHGENKNALAFGEVDSLDYPDDNQSRASSNDSDRSLTRGKRGGILSGKKRNKSAGLARVLENDTAANIEQQATSPFMIGQQTSPGTSGASSGAAAPAASLSPGAGAVGERATTYALRLDVDLEAMPPGSAQRREFTAHFQEDIARACGLRLGTAAGQGHEVHVLGLRHAPSLDWMTVVEFTFNLKAVEEQGSGVTEAECAGNLKRAHSDARSLLYQGMVTANVDASFAVGLKKGSGSVGSIAGGGSVGGGGGAADLTNILSYLNSPDEAVQRIFDRYKTAPVPETAIEVSCFSVVLVWQKVLKEMWVLNPRLAGNRNACLVYPHDVKRALGLTGTVHERYITPHRLVPLDLMPGMSAPIPFLPSPRSNGLPCIDATLLKSGLKYRVDFEDSRADALSHLSEDEKAKINEAFRQFDANGDGSISRTEAMNYAQQRTATGRAAVEQQFQAYVTGDERPTAEEVAKAESTKEAQLQALEDAEQQLMSMLEKADIDGDGALNYEEFSLAEAWWFNSTMNPEKVSLF